MLQKDRLLSLDILRGITITAMILVNDPGSWSHVYAPLLHAPWHGCTPTDLVFPFFLFMVGLAISLGRPKVGEARAMVMKKVAKRSAYLFLIGLFLNAFPCFDFGTLRILGVLQRIALVFLVIAMLHQYFSFKTQIWIGICLLIDYWGFMTLIPVPGVGAPNLEVGTNFAAWLDNIMLSGHMWSGSKTWDPEGILSTIPAVVTGLIGMMTGKLLLNAEDKTKGLFQVFVLANVLIVLGLAWGLTFPINKSLWTSSYVLYTGGIAMNFFAMLFWLLDREKYRAGWLKPFEVFGSNAITAYAFSGLLASIMGIVNLRDVSISQHLFELIVSIVGDQKFASLLYALVFVGICYLPILILYKKKIFIKV